MAGRMAMSACFGWEPIVVPQYRVQNCAGTAEGSRPSAPGVVAPVLESMEGRDCGGGGNDDAELAKPPCTKKCQV